MDIASALAHAIEFQHVALTEIRALDQSLARHAKPAMSDPPSLFAETSCTAQNVEHIMSPPRHVQLVPRIQVLDNKDKNLWWQLPDDKSQELYAHGILNVRVKYSWHWRIPKKSIHKKESRYELNFVSYE